MPFRRAEYDAVVVGAGPNGLAAAIVLARSGHSVLLIEGRSSVGGGCRSAAVTLPGFVHDICSAVYPLAAASPLFRSLPLTRQGAVSWVHPDLPLAHPLGDGSAAVLARSVEQTAASLGSDGRAWTRLVGPAFRDFEPLLDAILGPLRVPRRPLVLARFGLAALRSARGLAEARFAGAPARALFAGLAAHSFLPLERAASAAVGIVLGAAAHAVGWPFARGGAQRISDALAAELARRGGEIVTDTFVASLEELPRSRAVLLDVTPRQLLALAGDRLPGRYRRRLQDFRYGPAAFKVDFALGAPIPWANALCRRAGTVHVGGTLEEIADAERSIWRGDIPERPFVLVAQPSLFDGTRAPEGRHTAWAYCHAPAGCGADLTDRVVAQIERFAPGFAAHVLATRSTGPAALEAYNPNYVGGDINGGAQDLGQLFTRPVARWSPYATAIPGLFVCSSSTPPGGGVHGMCGFHAARAALRFLRTR